MSSQVANVVGEWKIVDYPKHPECVGYKLKINLDDEKQNLYSIHTHVINDIHSTLKYDPTNNKWDPQTTSSTEIKLSEEDAAKEGAFWVLISLIDKMEVKNEKHLNIHTDGEQVRLERT